MSVNLPTSLWRRLVASTLATTLALVVLILILASLGFYYAEMRAHPERGLFDAVWWAVVTVSTVGYGDIVPTTVAGRVIGMCIMGSGIGIMAALTGNLASALIERRNRKQQGLLAVKTSGHALVLGVNAHAPNLIKSLAATAARGPAVVLVAAMTPEAFAEATVDLGLEDRLAFCRGNPAQETVLGRASPQTARVAYILSNEELSPEDADQQTLLTALTFRGLAPKVPLYAEALLDANRKHLTRAGVDVTLIRGELTGRVLATMGEHPALWHFMERLMGEQGRRGMGARGLTHEEQGLRWSELVAKAASGGADLPVAVFRLRRDITIKELLDADSALDHFILELFDAYGQEGRLGQEGPSVLVNPGDGVALRDFDGLIFLRLGRREPGVPPAGPAPSPGGGGL
jgi:voltage-gated potassium channel